MSVNIKSPCKQCFFFLTCEESKKETRKKWQEDVENGISFIGMSSNDCFVSPEKHKKDMLKNLSCFGHFNGSIKCSNQCELWNECSIEENKNQNKSSL